MNTTRRQFLKGSALLAPGMAFPFLDAVSKPAGEFHGISIRELNFDPNMATATSSQPEIISYEDIKRMSDLLEKKQSPACRWSLHVDGIRGKSAKRCFFKKCFLNSII